MASDVKAQQQTGSPQADSSLRQSLRLIAKWRFLRAIQARADRAALTLADEGRRARRLYCYILKECDGHQTVPQTPDSEMDRLGRAARHALRDLIRPLKRVLLRRALWVLTIAFVICGAALLLVLALPSGRAWLFPADLGRTARWHASSAMGGSVTRGVGTNSDGPLFFHTISQDDPYVDLDLGKVVNVRRVVIENRSDCCGERALPLNVEVMEAGGPRLLCQRRSPFRSWTCATGGVKTQTLRIHRPGPTMLHLRRVEVYE